MALNFTQAATTPQAGMNQQAWIAQAAANGWNNPQQLLQDIFKYSGQIVGTSQDPTIQKLIDQGYLTTASTGGGEGGSDTQNYQPGNLPLTANGYSFNNFGSGGGSSKVFGGGTDTIMLDPSNQTIDPLWGGVTPNTNTFTKADTFDKVAPMIPMLIAGLMTGGAGFSGFESMLSDAGIGAGAEAGAGVGGLGLAKTGWSLTQGFGSGSFQSILDMLKGGGSTTTPAATTPSPSGGTGTINPQQLQAILPFILRLLQGSGNTGG